MGMHGSNIFLDDGPGDSSYLANTLEAIVPIEYRVEVYNGSAEPVLTLRTWGGWNIEGSFLCVHDVNGLKEAHIIAEDVEYIKTVEVAEYMAAKEDKLAIIPGDNNFLSATEQMEVQ